MRIVMDKPGTIDLGKQGENLSREIAFPEPAQWQEEFPGGAAQLLVRPNRGKTYPVVLEEDGDLAVWQVTAADTARAGYGRCELRWSIEGQAVKSRTYMTFVAAGLSGGCGCGTDNWGAYLDQILQAGASALDAAGRAEAAANRAEIAGESGVGIATDEEVGEMLEEVFGAAEEPPDGVATDEEIDEMLDEIFGSRE